MKSPLNPLRGWHVLIMILMFFGVMISVNATMVTLALRSHPGEDVERSYTQGLNYNATLDRRRQQDSLGWQARFNLVDSKLLLLMLDRQGNPLSDLVLSGSMRHPTRTALDCPSAMESIGDGRYQVDLPCVLEGRWRVRLESENLPPFEVEYELTIP
jgi:nitrogen fixation protein FixH